MSDSEGAAKGGLFPFLSAVSGGSLVVIGGLSLAFSTVFWSWAGVAISAALVVHGAVELRMRKRLLRSGDARAGRLLGRNQLWLAASVTVYAASQAWGIDAAWGERIVEQPLVSGLLAAYPAEMGEDFVRTLPLMALGFYGLVVLVVWAGCVATAFYYRSAARKLAASKG